jgi:DNA-binding IclR family transcriptional regulator
MRRLGLTHRVAVAFSLPHGTEMIYIERQESPEPFAASARLGGRAAIWAGAAGRAVLAQLDPAERELHLDHEEWHRLPAATRTEVLDEVVAARERGYAIDSGSFFEGVSGVAVAIRDHHGHPVAALSAIVPPERLRAEGTEMLGAALQVTADELEHVSGLLL